MSRSNQYDKGKGTGRKTTSRSLKNVAPKKQVHGKSVPDKGTAPSKYASREKKAQHLKTAVAVEIPYQSARFKAPSPYEESMVESERKFYRGERLHREAVIQVARARIPKNQVYILVEKGVGVDELSKILNVSEKTVRNYQNEDSKLSSQQSEQLIKVKQLLDRGVEIFGSNEAFSRWLHKPAMGLDFEKPIELLITSEGVNLVEDEVERIAYGDFS